MNGLISVVVPGIESQAPYFAVGIVMGMMFAAAFILFRTVLLWGLRRCEILFLSRYKPTQEYIDQMRLRPRTLLLWLHSKRLGPEDVRLLMRCLGRADPDSVSFFMKMLGHDDASFRAGAVCGLLEIESQIRTALARAHR